MRPCSGRRANPTPRSNFAPVLELFFRLGWNHLTDAGAWDHHLFLLALALAHPPVAWRRWIGLATVFALGHGTALALAAAAVLPGTVEGIEPLIAASIVVMAGVELAFLAVDPYGLRWGRVHAWVSLALAGGFGIIHGLGFSGAFLAAFPLDGSFGSPVGALLGFTCGVEAAQLLILAGVWIVAYVLLEVLQWRPLFLRKLCLALVGLAGLRVLSTLV